MRQSPLLLSILAALTACDGATEEKVCKLVPADQATCPAPGEVSTSDLFLPGKCGDFEISDVRGPVTREDLNTQGTAEPTPACCYKADVVDETNGECVIGRPYFEDGVDLCAPLRSDAPQVLASEAARAAAWAHAGAGEHASVAAFARLTLQLLALGAPTDLLRGAQQAALDEVGHAEQCWALAERFGAAKLSPGPFPFPRDVAVGIGLAELASAAVREGCLAETLGAHVAQVAADLAPEPDVRAALQRIAAEEATHAVLSFRIVAWALKVGGPAVTVAVHAAFDAPCPRLDLEELALRSNVDVAELQRAAEQGLLEVIRPAAQRLLAA
ncbi:MAG TPA: ferritin-like domain-containing protein [Polyangiaceae bacterium]|nr:ferritin-like domain-containing protein [Polyangiaceae bacterium]